MRAKDIMKKNVITINDGDPVVKALGLMKKHNISGLPVLDKGNKLVGIVTDGDILRALDVPRPDDNIVSPPPFDILEAVIKAKMEEWDVERSLEAWKSGRIKDIMSKPVITASPDTAVEDLVDMMLNHNINRIPIVDNEKLVGIVTRFDLIRVLGG